MKAYKHTEDGKQWMRVIDEVGNEWDEPIEGWCEVWDLIKGFRVYRDSKGIEYIPL